MTKEQKDQCLQNKIDFMEGVNEALKRLDHSHIINVKMDIFNTLEGNLEEYLVITFKGGAISVRNCYGNSSLANLEEFTKMMFGGYYSEVEEYKRLKSIQIEEA